MSYTPPSGLVITFELEGVYNTPGGRFVGLYLSAGSYDVSEFVGITEIRAGAVGSMLPDAAAATDTHSRGITLARTESAAVTDVFIHNVAAQFFEAIGLTDNLASTANTSAALVDTAAIQDIIRQAINQIVAETAATGELRSLGIASALLDIANAVEAHRTAYNVTLVAELIAAIEAIHSAKGADIIEDGVLADTITARITALVALLEQAQAIDTNTAMVRIFQSSTDSAAITESFNNQSLLSALLLDGAIATVSFKIGGEMFTGWVLNTGTLAASEYQFADREFNSACKHGNRYLMAADDGIYQFTEDAGAETVMTYIKTGKLDLGSDKQKRVTNAYIVYAADGNMTLKVTTAENGKRQTNNYTLVPPAVSDGPDVNRIGIGKGIRSRYWQFELVGANVNCDIDEIGMLPVVLSRRI